MEKSTFLIIGIIIVAFYLLQPVPYCKMSDEVVDSEDAVYTEEEYREVGKSEINLLHVTGTSMLPTLQDNFECICIRKNTYSVGDIVFFMVKMENEWVGIAHRIFSINGEEIITKGDSNNFLDPLMQEENIGCAVPLVARYKTLI